MYQIGNGCILNCGKRPFVDRECGTATFDIQQWPRRVWKLISIPRKRIRQVFELNSDPQERRKRRDKTIKQKMRELLKLRASVRSRFVK